MTIPTLQFSCRNESFQEQLWEMSISAVKEFLSPEVLQRYQLSPHQPEEQSTAAATSTAKTSESDTPEQNDTPQSTH